MKPCAELRRCFGHRPEGRAPPRGQTRCASVLSLPTSTRLPSCHADDLRMTARPDRMRTRPRDDSHRCPCQIQTLCLCAGSKSTLPCNELSGAALTGAFALLVAFWLLVLVILPDVTLFESSVRPYLPVVEVGGPKDTCSFNKTKASVNVSRLAMRGMGNPQETSGTLAQVEDPRKRSLRCPCLSLDAPASRFWRLRERSRRARRSDGS